MGPAVEQLRGSVVSEDLTSLSVAMDESVHRDGTGAPWRQEVVQVPRPLIREIDIRAFSPSRTLFAAFLTSAALVAVEKGFLKSGGCERRRDWPDRYSGRSLSDAATWWRPPLIRESRLTARAVASEPVAS